MKKQSPDQDSLRTDARAEYCPPRLESYGTVASITGSTDQCSVNDMTNANWGMFAMMTTICET